MNQRTNELVKIAVYGTLRKGWGNWNWAINEEPIETITMKGYRLGVRGLPFVEETGNDEDETVFELYEVNKDAFDAIDGMELGAGYTREMLEYKNEEYIWYGHRVTDDMTIIKDFTEERLQTLEERS